MKKQLTSDADVEFLEKEEQVEEVEAAHAVYERFKLEWMLDHGYTLKNLIEELEKQREECPDLTLDSTFRDWEFGFGFGSDIWPCFWEYYHSEYEPKKEELAVMDRHDTELLSGRYVAENREGTFSAYRIVMDVKETEKSYIMQLVAFKSRYSASHISHLFSKSVNGVTVHSPFIRSRREFRSTLREVRRTLMWGTRFRSPQLRASQLRPTPYRPGTLRSASPATARITGTLPVGSLWYLTAGLKSSRRTAARNLSSDLHTA